MKKSNAQLSNPKIQARKWSIGLHVSFLIAALLPFANQIPLSDQNGEPTVQIVFSNADISSGASSSAPQKASENKPLPANEVPTGSLDEVTIDRPIEKKNTSINEVEITDVPDESGDTASEIGNGDDGDAPDGQSLGEMEFDGDGIFGRKVIYRADVAQIAEKSGRVVVNLCINNAGTVSHAAFNRKASTIMESNYVKKAMDVASNYLFEQDYSAPPVQCGQLSFIFQLQ